MNRPAIIFAIMQSGARSNGGVQSIGEVMRRLKCYRPVVITNLENEFSGRWRDEGIEVHVEHVLKSAKTAPLEYAAALVRYHRRLSELIAANDAHVVHANDTLAFQLSLFASKLRRAKIVFNVRGTVAPGRRPPRLKYQLVFAAADHVLYLSHDMAHRWREVAPNATRSCSVTYSIVDPARFRPTPIDPTQEPVVLVSGLFWAAKGQLEFIRSVVPLLAQRGVKVWFTGDFEPARMPYSKECADAAQPFKESVRFLGHRSDMPELISKARVVAIPSLHEGLVRAMLEAMSAGRPVVSFDVCSARELLEEQSDGAGTVVSSGDYAGMAQAILRYCRYPEAASEGGKKGRATALRVFTPQEVVARYERVYSGISTR